MKIFITCVAAVATILLAAPTASARPLPSRVDWQASPCLRVVATYKGDPCHFPCEALSWQLDSTPAQVRRCYRHERYLKRHHLGYYAHHRRG